MARRGAVAGGRGVLDSWRQKPKQIADGGQGFFFDRIREACGRLGPRCVGFKGAKKKIRVSRWPRAGLLTASRRCAVAGRDVLAQWQAANRPTHRNAEGSGKATEYVITAGLFLP